MILERNHLTGWSKGDGRLSLDMCLNYLCDHFTNGALCFLEYTSELLWIWGQYHGF
jgi:hypothetical protein